MTTVSVSKHLSATAETVWQMVGGWNTLPAWHPEVLASNLEADGLMRRVKLADGMEILERLEYFSRAGCQYTYSIVDSPLPLSFYRSTIRVEPDGDGTLVTWFTEFEATESPADEVAQALHAFYALGLDCAARLVAGG